MIKTKYWVCGMVVLLLLSAAAWWSMQRQCDAGKTACIYIEGQCVRTIDLDAVMEPECFTFCSGTGFNTVCVEHGKICISDSDCPDQICVHTGWLDSGVVPIVCLPHQMVIQLEQDTPSAMQIDAVSQ